MSLTAFGPMSTRPGAKNTSWTANSSVNSSTLWGDRGAEGAGCVGDGLAATELGAGPVGARPPRVAAEGSAARPGVRSLSAGRRRLFGLRGPLAAALHEDD